MGLAHSPSISADSLAFCLDAANPRSYSAGFSSWKDLSGNNRNASIYGLSHSSSRSGVFTTPTRGSRAAFNYDPQTYFANSSWTWIIFWSGKAYADITTHHMPQLGYGSSSWPRLGIFRFKTGNCEFRSYNNGGHASAFNFAASPVDTGWVHNAISADYENSVVKAYYNGNYYNQKTGFPQIAHNNVTFGIGRAGATSWNEGLDGEIATVFIYNRALSADEIKNNYLATKGRFGL